MKKFDITILFLFAAQIYLYLTKSIATNFYISNLFSNPTFFSQLAFVFYCVSFIFLFSNFFTLFLAYKQEKETEKKRYILGAFLGTILFFVANFGFELLMLKIRNPAY